jgi:hypothetical protein
MGDGLEASGPKVRLPVAEASLRSFEETRDRCAAAQAHAAAVVQRAVMALATAQEHLRHVQAAQADLRKTWERAAQIRERIRRDGDGVLRGRGEQALNDHDGVTAKAQSC